ncbi:hypothetical protein [Cryptosporangium sp. NPDC051539]|uniref:hypothetical protein n=1 Tax=Cryptosporangium sp. NPDC051539 TaxID=3363962 RepID=UPI0037B080FC
MGVGDPRTGAALVSVRGDGPLYEVAIGAAGLLAAGGAAGLYGFTYVPARA